MLSQVNLDVAQIDVIWPSVVNGIAISFIFVPLTTATMSQLHQQQLGNATGLYNLTRNLGGSIGIAFVTTALARGAQKHQALLVEHITAADRPFAQRFDAMKHMLSHHADPATASHQAYATVNTLLDQQAHLMAYVDNFFLFGVMAVCGFPLIFLIKRVSAPAKTVETVH